MLFKILVVSFGEIPSKMYASAFLSLPGGLGHQQADSEHILALAAVRRIEDLVHDVTLPEADDFFRFGELLFGSGYSDVSPHKGPQ
jgi:hypothetical protein